jgi:hypothetical protein
MEKSREKKVFDPLAPKTCLQVKDPDQLLPQKPVCKLKNRIRSCPKNLSPSIKSESGLTPKPVSKYKIRIRA